VVIIKVGMTTGVRLRCFDEFYLAAAYQKRVFECGDELSKSASVHIRLEFVINAKADG